MNNYSNLPDKVKNAIELAQKKKKYSDFYYQLDDVNEKIKVYTKLFKTNVPSYQEAWMLKKKKEQEERQKIQEEEEKAKKKKELALRNANADKRK